MFYDAKSIANYFLELAAESGQRIDAIKLQKLVYFANGWYAGYTSQPLMPSVDGNWASPTAAYILPKPSSRIPTSSACPLASTRNSPNLALA